jgi:type IV secretory pathway VirB4 component
LKKVFNVLVEYSQTTNNKDRLNDYKTFRPIIFILDEAHLYFFSRWFSKNFDKEQLIILTQVRKRKISMYLITQELAQLDSTFRRLVPAVRKYYKGL